MTDRTAIAHAAADGLADLRNRPGMPVLLGFDGFVDSIIDVVDKRRSADDYDAIATIADFGSRISDAAGKSSNFELVTKLRKLGGNGPIMANAMAAAKLGVTYIGCVGKANVDPVFEDFTQRAEVHSLADPGYTDALEFHDGKLMLGKYDHVASLGAEDLDRAIGAETFRQLVERSALLGMINWVMMPGSETIWRKLIDDVLPNVSPTVDGKPRRIFIDLCDPAKRTDEDLKRALGLITEMNQNAEVIFGMNLSEADHVCRILGHEPPEDMGAHIQDAAAIIQEKLAITAAVIHPRQGAAAAVRTPSGEVETGWFDGPFVQQPKLSTGAGDNFNAGFCLGLLAELPVEQALCVGTATSGFYVRNARSPELDELIAFCRELPPPEGG
ncbi:MAG: PfkB family carbohydrate kinase [Phycisphaeraceae bacterium]